MTMTLVRGVNLRSLGIKLIGIAFGIRLFLIQLIA
jgi:hypothetical protein